MPDRQTSSCLRRDFFGGLFAGGTLAAVSVSQGQTGEASEPGGQASGIRITRVSGFRIASPRWKLIGKNSQRDVHGKFATDRVLRVQTDAGLDGIGASSVGPEQAQKLLGKDPLSFFQPGIGIVSPLGRSDAPLWDLVGKIYQLPAWQLFGGYGPEWVAVYDGSIYFADLLPEYRDRGIDRILEEVLYSLEQGHRALKIKIGRGAKWMDREEGFQRDVQVVQTIRQQVGPDVKLMVDANNGYDLKTAMRFHDAVDDELYFAEEMFPENVEDDLQYKAFLRNRGWDTLVADGESARDVEHFRPYIRHQALDVLQGDVRAFGYTNLLRLARETAATPIRLAPHNWGSFLGNFMQVVLGRGIPNLLMAEQDPGQSDAFETPGFELKEGKMHVPDTPGCGLVFKERQSEKTGKVDWVVEG